jgi:hypothetical protein
VIAIRRIYVYLLAFAGLLMLVVGVASLGEVVLQALLSPPVAGSTFLRDEVSRWGAAALIGLPVWLVHWSWAQRLAARSTDERASVLRRLYLYASLAVGLFAAAAGVHGLLTDALDGDFADAIGHVPAIAAGVVVWLFTWQITTSDRAAVGEEGGSATLRRWYVYTAAVLGLFEMLRGVREIIEEIWRALASGRGPGPDGVPDALVGLGVWVLHGVILSARFAEADRRSTLRSVAALITLAALIGATVYNLSQALYYSLARVFGVERPGGVGGTLLQAAAGPVSGVLVYGGAWLIAARAEIEVEAPRQLGARRLYRYLVAFVALATLAVGVGGLLWIVADALTQAPATVRGDWWRDRAAAFITAIVVGLPLWLTHWTPSDAIDADEARSFSRRLYVYLVLIASTLVLLYSLAAVVYRLLTLVLGAPPTASLASDLARDVADAIVAGALVAYHVLVLRADARLAPAPSPSEHEAGIAEAVVRLRGGDGATLLTALDRLRQAGFEVEVLSETPPPARTSPPAD